MSTAIQDMMQDIGERARSASRAMARASSEQKNQALLQIAKEIRQRADEIQTINLIDVERAKANGHDAAFVDRLTMTPKTIETMALGLEQIVLAAGFYSLQRNLLLIPRALRIERPSVLN